MPSRIVRKTLFICAFDMRAGACADGAADTVVTSLIGIAPVGHLQEPLALA